MGQSADPDQYGVHCVAGDPDCDSAYTVTLPSATNPDGSPATGGNIILVDFGYWDGGTVTTPVTLAFFHAEEIAGGYNIEWHTATEVGNVGFYLYADMLDGRERVQLNATLIATSSDGDSFEPQTYNLAVDEEGIDQFWLVDVDIFARPIWHGPFVPGMTYGSIPDPQVIDWAPIAREHKVKKAEIKLARVKQSKNSVKLIVREDGLYRVGYEALEALGLKVKNTRIDKLALSNQGRRVPVRVLGSTRKPGKFGPGGYVEFYGSARDSLYGAENVYVLEKIGKNDAPALPVLDDPRSAPAGGFVQWYMDTVTEERQSGYSLSSPADEPWYMKKLKKSGESISYTLTLDAYAGTVADATVQVEVWGDTDWPQDPDHHLVVELNDAEISDQRFDGRVIHRVETRVSEPLQEGANTLTVKTPALAGITQRANIDSVGVTYPRRFVARGDALSFSAVGEAFQVTGLSSADVHVYGVDGEDMERLSGAETEAQDDGSYSVRFPGIQQVATYHVVGASRVRAPDLAPLPKVGNLTRGKADAVVIAHADFINDDLAFLVGLREWQGYKIKVVDVDSIYAVYGDHLVHPEAIRAYIRDASDKLGAATFILAGGDNRDYHGYQSSDAVSFIPSLYARTSEFATFAPCDPCLGDLDGDNVQDVAISRLPVRTTAELAALVDKTIDYEFKLYGKSMVMAVDRYDSGNRYDFAVDGEDILAEVPAEWLVVEAFLDEWGNAANMRNEALIPAVNAGMAVTAFVGHSGPTALTFDPLFTANHAAVLNNPERPTVVAQWGCWNTYHVLPSSRPWG